MRLEGRTWASCGKHLLPTHKNKSTLNTESRERLESYQHAPALAEIWNTACLSPVWRWAGCEARTASVHECWKWWPCCWPNLLFLFFFLIVNNGRVKIYSRHPWICMSQSRSLVLRPSVKIMITELWKWMCCVCCVVTWDSASGMLINV